MSTKSVSVLTKYTKCMKNLQQQQQENRTVRQCKPCAKAGADLQVRNFLCSFFGWDCQTGGEIIVLGICSSGTFSSFSYSLSSVLGIWVVTFVIDCCCFVSSSSCCCSFFWGGCGGYFIFMVDKPQGQLVLQKLTFSKYVSHQLEWRELIRAWNQGVCFNVPHWSYILETSFNERQLKQNGCVKQSSVITRLSCTAASLK